MIFDLAMGGGFPDAGCQFAFAPPTGCPFPTPAATTVSGGTLKVDYVAVYCRQAPTWGIGGRTG